MSASITEIAVRKQLLAMRCERFEVGILNQNGQMCLRERWNARQVLANLRWLRRENAHGCHIFVRPSGPSALSVIDDLDSTRIDEMKSSGFEPALTVETSPGNFQVWLNHGQIVVPNSLATLAAKVLAQRFSGDPSSADCRHFGRLAGFTNQKPERRLDNGLQPFVRLWESGGRAYEQAAEFIDHVERLAAILRAHRALRVPVRSDGDVGSLRKLSDFHADPRYEGDLHRADMAWAVYAAARGIAQQEIEREILRARDLSKKGRRARRIQYAERTASKAIASCQPLTSIWFRLSQNPP